MKKSQTGWSNLKSSLQRVVENLTVVSPQLLENKKKMRPMQSMLTYLNNYLSALTTLRFQCMCVKFQHVKWSSNVFYMSTNRFLKSLQLSGLRKAIRNCNLSMLAEKLCSKLLWHLPTVYN